MIKDLKYFTEEYKKELSQEKNSSWKTLIIETVSMNRLQNYRATRKGGYDEVYTNPCRLQRMRKKHD